MEAADRPWDMGHYALVFRSCGIRERMNFMLSAPVVKGSQVGRTGREAWSERRLLLGYDSMALVWILQKRTEPIWLGIPNSLEGRQQLRYDTLTA